MKHWNLGRQKAGKLVIFVVVGGGSKEAGTVGWVEYHRQPVPISNYKKTWCFATIFIFHLCRKEGRAASIWVPSEKDPLPVDGLIRGRRAQHTRLSM